MSPQKTKNKPPYKLFTAVFVLIIVFVVVNNLKTDTITLSVKNNAGMAFLETAGNRLIGVFQRGKTVVWGWDNLPVEQTEFSLQTERVCVLDSEHLAAVTKTGRKTLSVFDLVSGQKAKEISVGWEDQEVWPRISLDKSCFALARKSPSTEGKALYEFLTVNLESELLGVPAALTIQEDDQALIDYAVGSNTVLYTVGSKNETGRVAAFDLKKGTILWDRVYDDTQEFCSVTVSPDDRQVLVGNRNGRLYKLDAQTGDITKTIHLLKEGETRPITNDYSVLNLAFSPDGKYYVATINPPAYVLETATDTVVHKFSPANKLVSKIAFSPDNQFIATSDIRAGYPVKVWEFSEENK